MASSGNRPWQGTVLGVLYILGVVVSGIASIFLLQLTFTGGSLATQVPGADASGVGSILATLGGFLVVPILALFIIGVFMTMGIFKGQRWSIIVAIVLTVLGILGSLSDISNNIGAIVINGGVLWLEIVCLKHPYYGG